MRDTEMQPGRCGDEDELAARRLHERHFTCPDAQPRGEHLPEQAARGDEALRVLAEAVPLRARAFGLGERQPPFLGERRRQGAPDEEDLSPPPQRVTGQGLLPKVARNGRNSAFTRRDRDQYDNSVLRNPVATSGSLEVDHEFPL